MSNKSGGRVPPTPSRLRKSFRQIEIPGFGLVRVSWWVAAGLSVGAIFNMPAYGLTIVPIRPRFFEHYEKLHAYCGPRPYSFYFYSKQEDLK